jgi:uncharacterized lipoprotein YajG
VLIKLYINVYKKIKNKIIMKNLIFMFAVVLFLGSCTGVQDTSLEGNTTEMVNDSTQCDTLACDTVKKCCMKNLPIDSTAK